VIGQSVQSSHLGFLSHEMLDKMIFQSPFQPGLFYDVMIHSQMSILIKRHSTCFNFTFFKAFFVCSVNF